jgi:hypothetical protein
LFYRVALIKADEWFHLTDNFEADMPIQVIKSIAGDETEQIRVESTLSAETNPKVYRYEFMPQVCDICLAQNEREKLFFENKKIFVTQTEDDGVEETNSSQQTRKCVNYNNIDDDCELIGSVHKKPRIDEDYSCKKAESIMASESETSQGKSKSDGDFLPSRRSKRARKNKSDIEVIASSFSTIKQVKIQVIFVLLN